VKWVALIAALVATVPLSTWLRRYPNEVPRIWMLVGFLPFVVHYFHLLMAVFSYGGWPGYVMGVAPPPSEGAPAWPGYVEGVEITGLDILVLALYLNLPRAQRPLPFRFSMTLYFFAVLLSTIHASTPETALFYCWQLARMFLVYSVATRACADPRVAPAILKGMAAGLIMQAGVVIWQRFGLGIFQTPGTFSHQNFLGIMSEFVLFPFFTLLVAGRGGLLPLAVTLAGCVVTVLSVSRANIALAGLGFVAVILLSVLGKRTSRNVLVLLIGAAALMALTPLATSLIEERGGVQLGIEREVLNSEAKMIVSDHPLGVGANQYVAVANNEGYRQKAGQYRHQIGFGSAAYPTIVHNAYLLVAAETGYPGLITFLILLVYPLIVAFRCGWQNRGDQSGDLLLGLGVALLIVYIHAFFEWVFLIFDNQYMLALEFAMIASLAQQLGYRPHSYRNGSRLGSLIRSKSKLANDAR
jgi:O-antigen ligase